MSERIPEAVDIGSPCFTRAGRNAVCEKNKFGSRLRCGSYLFCPGLDKSGLLEERIDSFGSYAEKTVQMVELCPC
jgi:hypothetical protein